MRRRNGAGSAGRSPTTRNRRRRVSPSTIETTASGGMARPSRRPARRRGYCTWMTRRRSISTTMMGMSSSRSGWFRPRRQPSRRCPGINSRIFSGRRRVRARDGRPGTLAMPSVGPPGTAVPASDRAAALFVRDLPGPEISDRLENPLRSHPSSRVRFHRDPGIGQEFAEPIGGMRRQTLQDILEVGERIDLMTLATAHQAVQGRRRPAAPVTPDEQVILPSDGLSTQAPFRDVVVDAQLAIEGVGPEIGPLGSGYEMALPTGLLGRSFRPARPATPRTSSTAAPRPVAGSRDAPRPRGSRRPSRSGRATGSGPGPGGPTAGPWSGPRRTCGGHAPSTPRESRPPRARAIVAGERIGLKVTPEAREEPLGTVASATRRELVHAVPDCGRGQRLPGRLRQAGLRPRRDQQGRS